MVLFGRKREEGRRKKNFYNFSLPVPSQIFCLYIGVAVVMASPHYLTKFIFKAKSKSSEGECHSPLQLLTSIS
ncbi:hypothetical protein [Okeania sp. SIO2B3]|uniref:hypothetical protein n=1 Tax=Okeania sp. SIO2B3 TaxID=2607784 RepID=UPI0013C130EC|nr:hypothetical protein [Okeania sp. SIO2B3]NET42340.1 hypothetical protein [Okeania sp. SIO2B3]